MTHRILCWIAALWLAGGCAVALPGQQIERLDEQPAVVDRPFLIESALQTIPPSPLPGERSLLESPTSNSMGVGDFRMGSEGLTDSVANSFGRSNPGAGIGSDFFGLDDNFDEGLVIQTRRLAMKIGGFLKVDAIHDFNPIGSTDSFVVDTIEVGAAPRENSRLHARQTRLNLDTRWESDRGPYRIFVEGDFFFNQREAAQLGENRFRLRHAYAQHGQWTVGQTWTTLADVAASPNTLDFEGQVASITTRRTLIRWTQDRLAGTPWQMAVAIEDPFTIIDVPDAIEGEPRTQTPDAVMRFRRSGEDVQFQGCSISGSRCFETVGLSAYGTTGDRGGRLGLELHPDRKIDGTQQNVFRATVG